MTESAKLQLGDDGAVKRNLQRVRTKAMGVPIQPKHFSTLIIPDRYRFFSEQVNADLEPDWKRPWLVVDDSYASAGTQHRMLIFASAESRDIATTSTPTGHSRRLPSCSKRCSPFTS